MSVISDIRWKNIGRIAISCYALTFLAVTNIALHSTSERTEKSTIAGCTTDFNGFSITTDRLRCGWQSYCCGIIHRTLWTRTTEFQVCDRSRLRANAHFGPFPNGQIHKCITFISNDRSVVSLYSVLRQLVHWRDWLWTRSKGKQGERECEWFVYWISGIILHDWMYAIVRDI